MSAQHQHQHVYSSADTDAPLSNLLNTTRLANFNKCEEYAARPHDSGDEPDSPHQSFYSYSIEGDPPCSLGKQELARSTLEPTKQSQSGVSLHEKDKATATASVSEQLYEFAELAACHIESLSSSPARTRPMKY
jgi:hypothetical protein